MQEKKWTEDMSSTSMNSHKSFNFVHKIHSTIASPLIDLHYSKDKIHNRISYKFWREITATIASKNLSNEQKVRAIHLIINERMMFNTEKQAGFDAESAEQAILDIL